MKTTNFLNTKTMKATKFFTIALFTSLTFMACSSDDDSAPAPVNEEEVITTITVTLTPETAGGTVVTLQKQDLDGEDGPNLPTTTISGNLVAGTTYNGSIQLLNETETPAEDITLEVEEEDDEHQFFYTIGTGLDVTTTYTSFDEDGNNLGTEFDLIANTASTGDLTFTLKHLPTKPNTGLSDAGGETDVEATFTVTVE